MYKWAICTKLVKSPACVCTQAGIQVLAFLYVQTGIVGCPVLSCDSNHKTFDGLISHVHMSGKFIRPTCSEKYVFFLQLLVLTDYA
jgi:hypothetical protein